MNHRPPPSPRGYAHNRRESVRNLAVMRITVMCAHSEVAHAHNDEGSRCKH